MQPVKTEWWGAGVVVCLERGADLHTAQLMPLPLIVSCFTEIHIGFTFLVSAHPGSPGKRAVKRVCVFELGLGPGSVTVVFAERRAEVSGGINVVQRQKPTSPEAAVELKSKTDGPRVVAVWNEANLARDNRRVDLAQLGDVRVDVAREHLQRAATNRTRQTDLARRSRSDRPHHHAHTRWTPPLPLASAAPRLAISQLTTSQWKPTTTTINQYSQDAALDTRVAHISALTFDLDL